MYSRFLLNKKPGVALLTRPERRSGDCRPVNAALPGDKPVQ
ncbi:hypothetical protein BN137_1943 [Cronobacter condimenti 1330]|uniref:Uncharacterized protein n=1 Tax=Cronobacter condimenti 1330 TaxID=1073999 RepID=K8A109_9ENTR|nr:hypothetical protein BN137_1943 [Cronobacter condimenti 1330]